MCRHALLHDLYTDGPLLAIGAFLLTADADEVGIDAAPAFGMADDQPGTALAAVDAALEVVRMLAFLLAGQVLGGQELLNFLPGLARDKRLMLAGIDGSPVAH